MSRTRYRQAVYKISVNGQWYIIPDKEIESGEGFYGGNARMWDDLITKFQKNPLSFFLPHGTTQKGEILNDGARFLNDWTNDITLVRAPSKVGKSYIGAAKAGFFAGPCDAEWPCFTEDHGIIRREWPGETEGIICSFSWDNVAILWGNYIKLWPRSWLGPYAPNWGMFPGEKGRPVALTFGDGRPKKAKLPCGITVTCLCDTQKEIHWESRMADWGHVDEQLSENKFDILLGRYQTSGQDFNPTWCTLTPFVIDDRPDTGAGGWMKRKIVDGGTTKGRTFAEYTIDMDCVPEAIVTKEKKRKAYVQNIEEPRLLNDDKKEREGRARYYAEWQAGGGNILSAWNPEIHWIEPFKIDKYRPSYYRMIDHGENPCAALLVAQMPWDDLVVFKEYYEYGRSTQKNAHGIVMNMCGNEVVQNSSFEFEGNTFDLMEERYSGMRFVASEMDGKSFGQKMKESGRLIGEAYNGYGLWCTPSDCRQWEAIIPLMQQLFDMDPTKEHINSRLGRPIPEILKKAGAGAPRIYVVNTCTKLRWEIEGWHRNPKTGRPTDKDDHLISCLKFLSARPRLYCGDWWASGEYEKEETAKPAVSDVTGY